MSGRNVIRTLSSGWVIGLCLMIGIVGAPCTAYAGDAESGVVNAQVFSTPRDSSTNRIVDRSWYGDKMVFTNSASTPLRYFDGSSVGIEVSASCPVGGTFSVGLYRNDNLIGIASLNRNGFSRAEWTGVGAGSYYFVFSKAADGAKVTCSEIAMFSW